MNLYLYDMQLNKVAMISKFTSLIWVRRYNEYGEFELYIGANTIDISLFMKEGILIREDDETVMIIEKVVLPEDTELGDYLIISGRSAESLLNRRINIERLKIGNYQGMHNAVAPLLEKNVLATAGEQRKIDLIEMKTDYPSESRYISNKIYITSERLGANVYENITELCKADGCGFKLAKNDKKLKFEIYYGEDRSMLQSANPRVIFKPDFGNLVKSEYSLDRQTEKNSTFVAGEGEGAERKTILHGDSKGLERKELFVDARDLSSTVDDVQMTEEEYKEALISRGNEKLAEFKTIETFDCEIDITRTYQYRRDFFVGDIVSCVNKYGIKTNARIVEISECFDESGYKIVPKVEGVN